MEKRANLTSSIFGPKNGLSDSDNEVVDDFDIMKKARHNINQRSATDRVQARLVKE